MNQREREMYNLILQMQEALLHAHLQKGKTVQTQQKNGFNVTHHIHFGVLVVEAYNAACDFLNKGKPYDN